MDDAPVAKGEEVDIESLPAAKGEEVDIESLPAADPKPNGDDKALESEEVARLRNQVEVISEEMACARSTINDLDARIDGYIKERDEMARLIEDLQAEVKVLSSIAARAAVLDDEVSRLQHELDSAMENSDGAIAELQQVRSAAEELVGEKSFLESRLVSLEERANSLVVEKGEADAEVAERDRRLLELELLVKALEEERTKRDKEKEEELKQLAEKVIQATEELEEKDVEISKAQKYAADAVSKVNSLKENFEELKVKQSFLKTREVEVADANEGKEWVTGSLKLPWVTAALSVGTVAAVTATFYMHYSSKR